MRIFANDEKVSLPSLMTSTLDPVPFNPYTITMQAADHFSSAVVSQLVWLPTSAGISGARTLPWILRHVYISYRRSKSWPDAMEWRSRKGKLDWVNWYDY
jgi:hypothetical protein